MQCLLIQAGGDPDRENGFRLQRKVESAFPTAANSQERRPVEVLKTGAADIPGERVKQCVISGHKVFPGRQGAAVAPVAVEL